MARARRSARSTGGKTKYTTDPFEIAGLSGDSDTGEAGETSAFKVPDEDSEEEFRHASNDEDAEEEEENEEVEAEDDDEPEYAEGESMDIDRPTSTPRDRGRNIQKAKKVTAVSQSDTRKKQPAWTKPDETRSRGILNTSDHVGKSVHLQFTFGTDERDLLAILHARERWAKGIDSGFPSRASLNAVQTAPAYTYGPTYGADPEDVQKESTRGWDWYYDGDVGEKFRKRQWLARIEEDEGRRYMPRSKPGKHTVLMGPADGQKKFSLGQFESYNFGDAWDSAGGKKKREGWMLNMGQKIQCMAWAPNQNGLVQYLAIVTFITEEQKSHYPDPLADKAAPAFRPSAPYPSALHIWAFKAKQDDSLTKTLDMEFKPRLRLALCTDWGDLRRISWCPFPRTTRAEDDEDVLKNVGLLAGVWGDGYVRVLDIKTNKDPNTTEFHKVLSPAFIVKPPSTMCTCVAWLSPTDIAVGCANGFVAVWSILSSQDSSSNHPLPYFYQQIHSTYILNISPAYPAHPHVFGTTSMDGETRLTSLLDPQKDVTETNRMRMGSPHITFSPFLQSFVSSDENDFARLITLRRFFATTSIARLPSSVSALAPCSPCHPSLLFGCSGGAVVVTNPLRRLMHSKQKQWQQTWFVHDWVQGPEKESSGVSRFQDGFRAESVSLLRSMAGDWKMVNGTMVITIYEEETNVTSVAWNPNQVCAGWASAGMGCGLLRVEDVALS